MILLIIIYIHSGEVNSGVGLSGTPVLRWGLGAIIIMLIVSTTISLGQKLWPKAQELIDNAQGEGRSLDMSSLAQYAYEAFEKYQALNEEE